MAESSSISEVWYSFSFRSRFIWFAIPTRLSCDMPIYGSQVTVTCPYMVVRSRRSIECLCISTSAINTNATFIVVREKLFAVITWPALSQSQHSIQVTWYSGSWSMCKLYTETYYICTLRIDHEGGEITANHCKYILRRQSYLSLSITRSSITRSSIMCSSITRSSIMRSSITRSSITRSL